MARILRRSSQLSGMLVLCLLLWPATCLLAADAKTAGAHTVDGLHLALQASAAGKEQGATPRFVVLLENVGPSDLNLRLGYSLANGKSHHPAAISMILTRPDGKARRLVYKSQRVAGRLDPLVVPLPSGGGHRLALALTQFVEEDSGGPFELAAGEHLMTAEFIGDAVTAQHVSGDMQGLALMPYWQGKVHSEAIKFKVAGKKN